MAIVSAVETEGLTKRFGSFTAVDHLSFSIREGEVFGVLGPNGSGKTTTVRMLACLISSSEGSARVGGYDIDKESLKVREIVGILTENPSLYERLTAYENMDFFADAYGLSDATEKRERIREMLDFFELWGRRKDKVATFSKGMKQKLAIARSLVHKPPILFLDEPTSGLDPESAKGIRDMIEGLSQHEKHTILMCTHRLEDAEKLCDRVMIIKKGKSLIVGSKDDLQNRIGDKPVLQVKLRDINEQIMKSLEKLKAVKTVNLDSSGNRLLINADDFEASTPDIVKRIVQADGEVLSVDILRSSLEDAYLKLVKEV